MQGWNITPEVALNGMRKPKLAPSPSRISKRTSARRPVPAVPTSRKDLWPKARRCRTKFLRHFPGGFRDETYIDWEREYKWRAHERFDDELNESAFRKLLNAAAYEVIASKAVSIESRTNLLFSFEKMALRDAVKSHAGARAFARGLFELLYGEGEVTIRFDAWCEVVSALPRRQTRVLTWPVATVFGFLARPRQHFYLKPNVTRRAFEAYGLSFIYRPRPNAGTYAHLLSLARRVKRDLSSLQPRDMIDVQSFLWVQGSDEYPD